MYGLFTVAVGISQPRGMAVWKETELATPPVHLITRHWHVRTYFDNHWSLLDYRIGWLMNNKFERLCKEAVMA
jgi:hypothetical protein